MISSPPPAAIAALFRAPFPARVAPCPDASAPVAATQKLPPPATCPALEISGNLAPGASVVDPAFDVLVPLAQLARAVPNGNVTVSGYAADGSTVFSISLAETGPFRLDVPLSPAAALTVKRIRVASADGIAERTATSHTEPTAELVDTGNGDFVFAWNANAFPAARIATEGDGAPTTVSGVGTYKQVKIASRSRYAVVDFSDGTRSFKKLFQIFGR